MGRVAFESVTKRFGDVTAVDDLTLEIHDEELLVLLGPSGCGKTTALRMVAGLDDPTDGVIRIGDRVVNDVEAKDRDVAMVFQSYALYPHMTVRRNVEFPLRARDVPKEDRDSLVMEAARSLGIEDLLDRKPAALSGGQRQRVALARAIVRRPAAFLMDEPLSNLDAKLRVQTRAELVELQRRLAATVLYVTHDQTEAMTMGHRVAILNRGVLQQVDAPQAVYERPANLFVAQFVGTPPMNTIAGEVRTGGNDVVVHVPGGRVTLPAALGAAVRRKATTRDVVLGVRPEHLVLGASRPAGNGSAGEGMGTADGAGLPATVMVIESLGHERHVVCRLEDSTLVIVRQAGDEPVPSVGARVSIATDAEHLHLFEATSGSRIEP